jgi:hypothetical protein
MSQPATTQATWPANPAATVPELITIIDARDRQQRWRPGSPAMSLGSSLAGSSRLDAEKKVYHAACHSTLSRFFAGEMARIPSSSKSTTRSPHDVTSFHPPCWQESDPKVTGQTVYIETAPRGHSRSGSETGKDWTLRRKSIMQHVIPPCPVSLPVRWLESWQESDPKVTGQTVYIETAPRGHSRSAVRRRLRRPVFGRRFGQRVAVERFRFGGCPVNWHSEQ